MWGIFLLSNAQASYMIMYYLSLCALYLQDQHFQLKQNVSTTIIYINSVSLSVTEVLGGGGRERPVKQRVISSVSLFVEVLKPRSRLFVCRGPETQIPNCKSKITAQKPAWLLFSWFS